MLPKFSRISGLLAVAAAVLATSACDTNKAKSASDNVQSPVVPTAGLSVTLGSTRFTLQVADDNKSAVITVQALRTVNWTPVADQTEANFSTTLGAFGSPSGGLTQTVEMFGGKASVVLYPGSTAGSALVRVEVEGVSAQLTITIKPDPTGGVPPEPAPVQTTLALQGSPGVVSQADVTNNGGAPTSVLYTVTVLGSDGNPFSGAGVFLTSSSGLGTFASSGSGTSAVLTTNGSGQAADTLNISDADLLAFPSASFAVVAHLGVTGGEKTASFTVTVVAGPAPSEATTVILSATSSTTIPNDGGGDEMVGLDARVFDQFAALLNGAIVEFSSGLGTISPTSEETGPGGTNNDATGHATALLTVTDAEMVAYPFDSFTVTATVVVAGGTISAVPLVVNITRPVPPPPATLSASFTADDTTPCNNAPADTFVQFTDTSTGSILTWEWDLDGDGFTNDSNVADPLFNYDTFTAGVPINVTLKVSAGVTSDSFSMVITPEVCP